MSKSLNYSIKLKQEIFETMYPEIGGDIEDKTIENLASLFIDKVIDSHKSEKKIIFFNKVKKDL